MGCLLQTAITQLLMACLPYRGHRPIPDKDCEWLCLGIGLVLPSYGDETAVLENPFVTQHRLSKGEKFSYHFVGPYNHCETFFLF